MGERGPDFSSFGRESILESDRRELLRRPQEVFDSPLEDAARQHLSVLERLADNLDISRHVGEVDLAVERGETRRSHPSIKIAWTINSKRAWLLSLTPMSEGRGIEAGTFGYVGQYGKATLDENNEWEFSGGPVSLEQLYKVPAGLRLIVKPTASRWAVGREREVTMLYGER